MKPITFKGINVTFAKNQPPYLPLSAFRSDDGLVVSLWEMSWKECFKILLTRKVWLSMMTFNNPPMPVKISTNYPFEKERKVTP